MKAPDPVRDSQVLTFCFSWFLSLFISSLEGESSSNSSIDNYLYFILMSSLWIFTGFILWILDDRETINKQQQHYNFKPYAGFPLRSCNYRHYRKKRQTRHYGLRQCAVRRKQEKPVQDRVFNLWDFPTWRWPGTQRTPVPTEQPNESWWEWFFPNNRTQKSSSIRIKKSTHRTTQGRLLRSKKRRRRPVPNKPDNKRWSHSFGEAEQQQQSDYAQFKHRLLHQLWVMYDMQFGVSLDELIDGIDPARQRLRANSCGIHFLHRIYQLF
jgi:hypothetical protein